MEEKRKITGKICPQRGFHPKDGSVLRCTDKCAHFYTYYMANGRFCSESDADYSFESCMLWPEEGSS